MSDLRGRRGTVDVQLGARAKSILKGLSRSRATNSGARSEGVDSDRVSGSDVPAERVERVARGASGASTLPATTGSAVSAPDSTVVPLPPRVMPRKRGEIAPAREDVLAPARRRGAKRKTNVTKISAVLSIALPTALATVYFAFIASPQYVAEARFAVRGAAELPTSGGSVMGALTGLSGGGLAMAPDSFIVAQYIESSQMVAKLNASLDLRSIYTYDTADFIARYRPYDSDDTIEHLTRYWNEASWVYYEPITGIITLTVRAFTPSDALKLAQETVRESEKLVNDLSERAREDAVKQAKQEQSRAELRMKFARKAVQDYRDRQGAPDAQTAVAAQFKIVSDLEGQLAKQEAELAASSGFLSKDAPTIRFMQKNVDALKARVAAERAKIGSQQQQTKSSGAPMSASMAEYETMATEREFAEKAYLTASQAVDSARMAAERQSRYLATFVQPHLPEDSLYPARLQMILLVFLASAMAWGIGVLIFYGIRDHSA